MYFYIEAQTTLRYHRTHFFRCIPQSLLITGSHIYNYLLLLFFGSLCLVDPLIDLGQVYTTVHRAPRPNNCTQKSKPRLEAQRVLVNANGLTISRPSTEGGT